MLRRLEAVGTAVLSNDLRSGALTLNTLAVKLAEHEVSMEKIVHFAVPGSSVVGQAIVVEPNTVIHQAPNGCYVYDGKFWSAPKKLLFPLMKMRLGWQCWMRGLPGNKTQVVQDGESVSVSAPIRAFCSIKPSTMPQK